MTFRYSKSDFIEDITKTSGVTSFDDIFEKKWKELHNESNVFRYKLNIEKERITNGSYGFLLQLNIERAHNRRAPDTIETINQPFDSKKFNFTKVPKIEHIFDLRNTYDIDTSKHVIIINASPICYGHSLFCPNIDEHLPQIITFKSLELVSNIMFLSSNINLRLGFNSLCGMASVNHLHYHIFILNYRLPVEYIKCQHLKGPLYEMVDYPAKCFGFEMRTFSEISDVCSQVYKLIRFLMDNNIAHNLYMTKGDAFDCSTRRVIRILVWVRTSTVGAKEMSAFNLAICEFSGQFPIKNATDFLQLTEDDIISVLEKTTVPVFKCIRERVIDLY
ncbi:GDP-D-glucose phosphorylase 1 [Arctopsyche grandis]|uniref:GDP-D-glucose phosphorylase 1 n=1 Tax=Arctopsyche grandis TaxID=121162 RepID=UPI00406D7EF9